MEIRKQQIEIHFQVSARRKVPVVAIMRFVDCLFSVDFLFVNVTDEVYIYYHWSVMSA